VDKRILAFVFTALSIGGIVGYSIAPSSKEEITSLESQISTLKANYINLNIAYNELLTDYEDLNATYTALETEYGELESEINENLAKIEEIEARTTELEQLLESTTADKDYLQSQVNSLQAQIESKDSRIADLESLIGKSNLTVLGVYFSPRGGAADQVVNWIDRANETIHVLIYSFTNDEIGDAVARACQRGVEIKAVFEESQVSKYSEYWKLKPLTAQVRNDTNPSLMHHKVAVIDGHVVLTGSFNWSAAAEERNNENLMVLKSSCLAMILEEEFEKIWAVSV